MYDLSDICSLCLEREQNLKSIISADTDGTVVAEKIRIFLIEIIHFKPHIQKYICNNCLESLNYIHKFREKCLENILKLNEFVQKLDLQQSCKNYAVQNSSEPCENEIHSVFIKEEPEDYDESTDHTEENDHTPEYVLKMEIEETQNENDFQSSYEVSIECKEEEKNITSSRKQPSSNTSPNDTVKNDKCGKKIKSITHRSPKTEKLHKCDFCDKPFRNPGNLVQHRRIHTNEKPFNCEICGKAFREKSTVTRHKRTHTGEKPFKCDICGKGFNQSGVLTEHRHIHSNEKPYKCDLCDKAFNAHSSLRQHKRRHTGAKPYKCDVCGIGFNEKASVTRHALTHTKEKPFKCSACNKGFNRKDKLGLHVQKHNEETV